MKKLALAIIVKDEFELVCEIIKKYEKYFDEIEKTVNKLFSTDTNKQYVAEATENIDKVFAVEEREVPITNSTQNNAKTLAIEIADMEITEENKTERAEKLKNVQNSKET